MGYKLGIGFLLFGILLSNFCVHVDGGWFFVIGLFFGLIGLIQVAVAYSREKKAYFSHRTFEQYGQYNQYWQNSQYAQSELHGQNSENEEKKL